MLHEYYNKYAKVVPRKAYAVERCADVEVDGLLIRYIVDRIDVRPSKKIWLIDYKTGKHVPSSAEQLWFYQKIAKYDRTLRPLFNTGAYLDTLMFLHVNTCTEYPVDPASPKALKSLWTRVLASAQGVRDSRFPTNRGSNCKWCDYAQQCSNGNVSDTTDKF